jgi:hypothetical protein
MVFIPEQGVTSTATGVQAEGQSRVALCILIFKCIVKEIFSIG